MANQDYSQYPKSYVFCFLSECSRHKQCTHFIAGQNIRNDSSIGYTVLPPVLKHKEDCPYFQKIRIINGAWGFDALFENIKYKDSAVVRKTIKDYLGGNGTYSRYKRGERLLTPEQQTWIIKLFNRYGYYDNLHFDHYKEIIDW